MMLVYIHNKKTSENLWILYNFKLQYYHQTEIKFFQCVYLARLELKSYKIPYRSKYENKSDCVKKVEKNKKSKFDEFIMKVNVKRFYCYFNKHPTLSKQHFSWLQSPEEGN